MFIAVDGEGVTDATTNDHRYVLLCDSTGRSKYQARGISTRACLDFLLGLEKRRTGATVVGFGLGYDVNCWLRDLPRDALAELWERGQVGWQHRGRRFWIEWIPGKLFVVKGPGRQVKVYDAWGFFQSSFVAAIGKWQIGQQAERDEVIARKAERADFDVAQLDDVRHYCQLECRMLVELMGRLVESLDAASLRPAAWYGPGAIAAKLLQQRVKAAHLHDGLWPEYPRDAIMRAYFGGRVELFQQGQLADCTTYDVRSAYPAAATRLPWLRGGEWERVDRFADHQPHGIYHVRFRSCSQAVTPFPVRIRRAIYYPTAGEGWYHAAEVKAAIETGHHVDVIEGFVFLPVVERAPFEFVDEFYTLRAQLKDRGDPAEYAYKLALNSLYGKLAQGLGFAGKTPAFQSYLWAGEITARTRGLLLRMLMRDPRRAVFAATDAVAFAGDPILPRSVSLGGLERSHLPDLFTVQPGVYHARDRDGFERARSRGFFVRDLDFDAMRRLWQLEGRFGQYAHTSRRFLGLGSSLPRVDWPACWRRWVDEPRTLKFYAQRKWYQDSQGPIALVDRLVPPSDPGQPSDPYVPKLGQLDLGSGFEDADFLAGLDQPRIGPD